MQKIKYETPDMEIIEFENEDIITASGMNDLGSSFGDEGTWGEFE